MRAIRLPRGRDRPGLTTTFLRVPERFLIGAYGPDDDAVRVGLRWLVDYAREHSITTAAVLVPGISNAENLARSLHEVGTKLYRERQATWTESRSRSSRLVAAGSDNTRGVRSWQCGPMT
jgi:hypothetical protein